MNIYDLAERIDIGKNISFTVWRESKLITLYSIFAHLPHHDYAITDIFEPVLQKVGYVIVGGIVFMDLTINHLDFLVESSPSLVQYYKGINRLQPRIIISTILPEASLPEGSLVAGDLLSQVNGQPVNTLGELEARLDQLGDNVDENDTTKKHFLSFETAEGSLVVVNLLKTQVRRGHAQSGSSGVGSPGLRETIADQLSIKKRKAAVI